MLANAEARHLKGKKILLLTPFHRSQRGNSLTSERIQNGLKKMEIDIDLLSLEDQDWENTMLHALSKSSYALIHGFHGLHFARVLEKMPDLGQLPLLLTMTGTDINFDLLGAHRELVLTAMRTVQRIIVFNQAFLSALALDYPEFQDKLQSIPQGIQLEPAAPMDRKQLGLEERDFVFILPSGLRKVKNIELALDALSQLWHQYPQLRLLVLGASIEDDYSEMIMNRIDALPWVTYLGEVPHHQVQAYYRLADVVLNTSEAEGQPQAALEAMSLAKPAILTAVPGNLGIMEDGVQGLYAQNSSGLQAAAARLIQDPKLKQDMGQAAAQLVGLKFQAQREFNAHAALYRQILAGAGS
ncbi:MAG: glycosyltransferase family 4 protein [Syntrophomonadaceae bacterium]|nr:glycosyltransferase family 4 protein [Syntrophomonadaceae bacterium]